MTETPLDELPPMLGIPRRSGHFVFGIIQSGLTSLIAATVASIPLLQSGWFIQNWMISWLISWIMMRPAVVFAAPAIKAITNALTQEENAEEDIRPGDR